MKSTLVMTTRGFNSDYKSLYEQMAFLGAKYDNIYFVHFYSTEKVVDYIRETAGIRITKSFNLSKEYDAVTQKKYSTWKEFYENVDLSFLDGIEIDDVWMFGAPLLDGANLKRGRNGLNKAFEKNTSMTFVSVAKVFMTNYLLLAIANRRKVHYNELSYDPGEFPVSEITVDALKPVSYTVYHGYTSKEFQFEKLDSYQVGLKERAPRFFFSSDEIDVVFGYSYMTEDRKEEHEKISHVWESIDKKFTKRLLLRTNQKDLQDTSVSKDEYMSLINDARFTFIVPAYEKKAFSGYRFIESVFYDCLPLVFDHCNYKDFFDSYGVEGYEKLLINKDTVNQALSINENERLEILSYLKGKLGL